MFMHLKQSDGDVICTTVPDHCLPCMSSCEVVNEVVTCICTEEKRRRGLLTTSNGIVYLCSADVDLVNSKREFKKRLRLLAEMISNLETYRKQISDQINKNTNRLLHNLTSLNAHSIQEIYAIAPLDLLSNTIGSQLDVMQHMVEEEPRTTARMLLRINKNNIAMKSEFNVFKKLYETAPLLQKRRHFIKRITMNVLHIFFQDFTDKGVSVVVEESNSQVELDYESFQVAFFHLIENAAKYILDDTILNVEFPVIEGRQCVDLNMVSLEITADEFEKIFDEGYSSEMARILKLSGNGVGLGIIRQILDLNDAKIIIERGLDPGQRVQKTLAVYEKNRFRVMLGKPI